VSTRPWSLDTFQLDVFRNISVYVIYGFIFLFIFLGWIQRRLIPSIIISRAEIVKKTSYRFTFVACTKLHGNITYAKHPIKGIVKIMLMMKYALGIVSSVLLYTTLYKGRITLFDKFSVAILTEFMEPIQTINGRLLINSSRRENANTIIKYVHNIQF